MIDTQLLIQVIARLDNSQTAIQAALEELALWVAQQGAAQVAGNISATVEALNENAQFIAQGIAQLTVAAGVGEWGKGNPGDA
ncbi:hypothetical protein [Pseudomonas sp. TE3610]